MQSFLSVLVILGALFIFAGNGGDGTAMKAYYAIAAALSVLAYIFYFEFTGSDTLLAL